jgi:hypothetical protein
MRSEFVGKPCRGCEQRGGDSLSPAPERSPRSFVTTLQKCRGQTVGERPLARDVPAGISATKEAPLPRRLAGSGILGREPS